MLKYLRIRNWKAFEDKSFEFKERRINFIVGKNGVGKTTVLEAICLALSGDTTHPDFLSLVRDKKKPAKIELRFRLDSQEYTVTRQFSYKSKQRSELKSGDKPLCSNWDPVSDKIMELLGIESAFFRRLTYMSEGEIYAYLREPPDEALNRRIRYIFGIHNLLAVEKLLNKLRVSFTNQIKNTKTDLGMLQIRPKKILKDFEAPEQEAEKLRRRTQEIEDEKRKVEGKISQIKESIPWYQRGRQLADQLISTISDEKALREIKLKPLSRLTHLLQKCDSLIRDIEKYLTETQRKIGDFQSRKKYFEGIKNLILSLEHDVSKQASVPCPVCKRPIDKDMGRHLAEETDNELRQIEEQLSEISKKRENLEISLEKEKGVKSSREECRIQLANMPKKVLEEIKEMSPNQIETKIDVLENSILKYSNDIKKIEGKSSELEAKINATIQEISDMKAEQRSILLKKELQRKLTRAHKGEMLATISASAIKDTLVNIRNVNLEPLFILVSDLFQNFRPERKWQIKPPLEGKMEIEDTGTKYKYEDLSGGEKTVLLVLTRVLICKAFSNVGFLMIDEPLEHLDVRNRRSLINFLSMANEKNIIPQMIVTTFEETLLRKHFYDQKVKTEFLQ